MRKHIRIGTRGSQLALYQAYRVKDALEAKYPELTFEIVVIKTKGDKILDVPLSKIGDKGLFTKELEIAMFNHEIDMAVHSLKDLPTVFPEGTKLGAVLERASAFDALVTKDQRTFEELTSEDIIATSSLRRKAQLLKLNPNLTIVEIRGNVNTRIRKMEEGYCSAMIMAAAGLQRLGMDEHISEVLSPDKMIPACAQGAIAIEILEKDQEIENLLNGINHPETMITSGAERTFLRTLEGGCQIPVGSHSEIEGNTFTITGFISNLDGSVFIKDSASGPVEDAHTIANKLAEKLLNDGGKTVLDTIKANIAPQTGELPLKGKTIISTRPVEVGDDLSQLLKAKGANVIEAPMIRIETAVLSDSEKAVLKDLQKFNWVFFTSKNGVIHFFKQLIEINGNTTLPETLKIAVIGEKTAAELDYYGYGPQYISPEATAEEFVAAFKKEYHPEGQQLLLALGNIAGTKLEEQLSEKNDITRLNVYNTLPPVTPGENVQRLIQNNQYNCILFTSPSTVQNFHALMGRDLATPPIIGSIGPVTTKAVQELGWETAFEAAPYNSEGLVSSIIQYFSK